jgi:hypothetical protein
MIKHKSILLAVAGALLLAAPRAQTQSFSYSAHDLLLNFRDTGSITANDLEVNLGPISALAAFQGTETVVPASLVQSVYGLPSPSLPIGFSAAAADAPSTTGTLWLTRADSTPGSTPTPVSAQQVFDAQNLAAERINNIGTGANAGMILAPGHATVPGGTSGFSYQAQGEQSTAGGDSGQATINFGGDENIAATKGGDIEIIQNGGGAVYAALWEVPVVGTPDTYLGYFTFQPSGEVDYTSASVVSQPPVSLVIVSAGPNSVKVLWPNVGNYTLQQNSVLTSTGWSASGYNVSTSNGTNSVTITPATGNLFFRLAN